MDILNWIYSKRTRLIKEKADNPDKDLVALASNVGFSKRDDQFQTYAMTLADAVHDGCTQNNTLYTGIYDNYPFAIGYPVLLKTCTQVIDTPSFPTVLPVNLQGWKVSGSIIIDDAQSGDVLYLGSVENVNNFFTNFPWKITGTVYTWDDANSVAIYTTLANGATVYDQNGSTTLPCNFQFVPQYFPGGFDLFLVYDSNTLGAEVETMVSFEYEFLNDIATTPTLTYYP